MSAAPDAPAGNIRPAAAAAAAAADAIGAVMACTTLVRDITELSRGLTAAAPDEEGDGLLQSPTEDWDVVDDLPLSVVMLSGVRLDDAELMPLVALLVVPRPLPPLPGGMLKTLLKDGVGKGNSPRPRDSPPPPLLPFDINGEENDLSCFR